MISIIVPIYKAEKYIRKCIESILMLQYKDWELLLIDDGSPDDSGRICDEYANNDNRIRVFHKLNGGVSSARNMGLDEARGEWIMFVDADDSISPETIIECSQFFNDFDIIRFEATDSYGKTMCLPNTKPELYLEQILGRHSFLAVWGGLYKKELFELYSIRFNTGLKYGEDWEVLIKLISKTNKTKLLHKQFYNYNNQNENSFLNTMSFDKLRNLMIAFSCIYRMVGIQEYIKVLDKTLYNLYYTSITTCNKLDNTVLEFNTHVNMLFDIFERPAIGKILRSEITIKRKVILILYRSTICRSVLYKIIKIGYK